MLKIRFLSLTEVNRFHEDQLSRFGGLYGIRSQEILKATTLEPQMTFDGKYLYCDLFEMATCYLFGIIKNHPFLDGNKRTGILCAIAFLRYNGINIRPSQDVFYQLAMKIASSNIDKSTVTTILKTIAQNS